MNPLLIAARSHCAAVLALAVLAASGAKAQTVDPGTTIFESAMAREFAKPEVRAEIGWTKAQETTFVQRNQNNRLVWVAFEARVAQLRKDRSAGEALRQAVEEKGYDLSKIEGEETALLTPLQAARLKRVVLSKGGMKLWNDAEVAGRLGLSPDQRHDTVCGVNPTLSPDQKTKFQRLTRDPSAWLESYTYRTMGRTAVRAQRSEAVLEDGGRRMRAITYWQQDGTVVHMVRIPSTDTQASPEFEVTVQPANDSTPSA